MNQIVIGKVILSMSDKVDIWDYFPPPDDKFIKFSTRIIIEL